VITQQNSDTQRPYSLEERRQFQKLPLEERRRQLAEQAQHAAAWYQQQAETAERIEWQGGEILES
jgi:hypothetical protein